jgi:di/tricarboxylate transporter
LVKLWKQPGVAFIIPGVIFILIGLPPVLGYPAGTWEIMGRTILPSEYGLPLAVAGVILLLIGLIITYYYYSRNKD